MTIAQKKKVFQDFALPWPVCIEQDLKQEISARKAKGISYDGEAILDRMATTRITWGLDHYAEVCYCKLWFYMAENHLHSICETEIRKVIGKYAIDEVKKAGYIIPCGTRGKDIIYTVL